MILPVIFAKIVSNRLFVRKLSVESSNNVLRIDLLFRAIFTIANLYFEFNVLLCFLFPLPLYVVHGLRLFKQIVSTNKNIVLLIAEDFCV